MRHYEHNSRVAQQGCKICILQFNTSQEHINVRWPRRATSDFRLLSSDFRLPTSDFRVFSMDNFLAFDILKILEMFLLSNILIFSYTQLFFGEIISRFLKRPTSDLRLPTSDFRLPTSDFRLPTFTGGGGQTLPV